MLASADDNPWRRLLHAAQRAKFGWMTCSPKTHVLTSRGGFCPTR